MHICYMVIIMSITFIGSKNTQVQLALWALKVQCMCRFKLDLILIVLRHFYFS